jgi:branched-chain amino acid transport system substrate-binding protein
MQSVGRIIGQQGRRGRKRILRGGLTLAAASLALAACGSSSTSSTSSSSSSSSKAPIVVGTSLSLTGDFASNGVAFQQGYNAWVHYVNAHGGLLGHKISLKILNDTSSPSQVATNYQDLITTDHVPLIVGPFSSLLTVPAAKIASRYGYAMIEGAGGAPSVFSYGLKNVFDVSYPIKIAVVPTAKWIASLPKSKRPTSAAYVTSNNIFAQPQIAPAQAILQKAGIRTVYNQVFQSETTDFTPLADAIVASHAQVVVLSSTSVSKIIDFVKVFSANHFYPKVLIGTNGVGEPTFVNAVGKSAANGIIEPNGWYPGYKNALSAAFIKEYLKLYGGSAGSITASSAEAFGTGEVLAQAVQATHSFNQAKILKYLHSGAVFQTDQGPVKFNAKGENVDGIVQTFQWQNGGTKLVQILPKSSQSVAPLFPRPAAG